MRYLALAGALALAGCGSSNDSSSSEQPGDPIDCALGEGAEFAPVCLYEYDAADNLITVRHPDGGFRRFEVLPGGAGVIAADGADEVIQGLAGGMLEVTVGSDQYRMPTKPVS